MNAIVISKPSFAFIITESKYNRRAGSSKVTAKVLMSKNDSIELLGEASWITSSCKGSYSEVYEYIFDHTCGFIPEDEYTKNGGYYPYSDSAISIKEL